MTSRDRIQLIMNGEPADRCGLWLGNPHDDTWPLLHRYFETETEEEFRLKLGDDFRWILPFSAYKHPEDVNYSNLNDKGKIMVYQAFFPPV